MPTKVQHTYLVLFKGDDSDFIGNQNIVLNLETDLDLTGCKAHFKFLDFAQDFTEIPDSKQLELVFPKAQTAKFPLGAMDAELWLEDSEGKRRTVSNRIHIVVTNSVPEAYNNEDTQAITVVINGEVNVDIVPPSTDPEDEGKAADAYATGNALSGKLSKAEAKAGFTEWKLSGLPNGATGIEGPTFVEGEPPMYSLFFTYNEVDYEGWTNVSGEDVASIVFACTDVDDTVPHITVTATRTRLPTMADLDGKASTNDVALAPVYSGNGERFGEWICSVSSDESLNAYIVKKGDYWEVHVDTIPPGDGTTESVSDEGQTEIEFDGTTDGGISFYFTATRTENPIIGYTLGDQTTKPLQPQGEYAPATNIPKTALASDVQMTLVKADTAVQPSALRYDLVTITTGQMQDRAVQKVELNAASTTLVLPALTDLTGKVADFGIDMVNAYEESGTAAAASFQLSGTLGTDYNLVVPKGETWSDMTALAAGEMAVFYFTRSAFQNGDVPTWEVVKKVVEFVPVPSAP